MITASLIVCLISLALNGAALGAQERQTSTSTSVSAAVPEGGVPKYLRTETAEQRRARIGTAEDPGLDPDPAKHFWRFGKSYHIERFERRWAAYDTPDAGWVRPMAQVNIPYELYQQNDKYVWVWIQDPIESEEQAQTSVPTSRYTPGAIDFFQSIRSDFTELTPPRSRKVVKFEEASTGLPTGGSYRNSLAVADMNGDGCPDIILPPEREGSNLPAIYLGDCKGHWTLWKDVHWPHGLDYGSVVAADFNRDGHMDLAFAVHMQGIFVWLGDGKGNFTEVEKGLPRDFPTRRLIVADVDGDGDPDLVAISEGPTMRGGYVGGKIRVYLNRDRGKRWEAVDVVPPTDPYVGGDWLTSGDFNGDGRPDFAGASVYFNSQDILWLSDGKLKWKKFESDGRTIPSQSYYFASAAGKFTSKKRDDLIVSYVHFWPNDLDPLIVAKPPLDKVVNIDRLSFLGGKFARSPIMRWQTDNNGSGVWGMAAADFDGDGTLDILLTRFTPRDFVLLLGDGRGGFTRAETEGLPLEKLTNYDLKVADVDGDGTPDVIVMYETGGSTSLEARTGSVHVFLNRGVVKEKMK